MYEYLLDCPERDTVEPSTAVTGDVRGSHSDLFMTRYQRERQRAYDRALRLFHDGGHLHPDVEDAQAEAALVREQAVVSRARGGQLRWVKSMLRRNSAGRLGVWQPG